MLFRSTGNPNIEMVFHKKTTNAQDIEKKLHSEFSNERINGEWFEVSFEKIITKYYELTQ